MARSYLPLGRALVVLAAPAIALGSPRGPHVSLRVCGPISPSSDPNQVELLAVLQDTLPPPCAGAISVINHWYGRDDIPIGAYKGSGLSLVGDARTHMRMARPPAFPFVRPAFAHQAGNPPLTYVESLVSNFPSPIRDSSQVPDAVDVYRRVLAASPARSVTIASVGLLTNLELLLRSAPDAHSPLTGRELVAEKVTLLAVMAGDYPWGGMECNACGCYNGADAMSKATAAAASSYVAANTPSSVRVIYLGFRDGDQVRTGAVMATCASAANPCRHALEDFHHRAHWGWGPGGRSSYDPLTTLFAVRGLSVEGMGFSDCDGCDGFNSIDPTNGRNQWVAGPPSNQSYAVLRDRQTAEAALDQLLCQPRLADLPSPAVPPPPPVQPPQQPPVPPLPPPPVQPPPPPPALSSPTVASTIPDSTGHAHAHRHKDKSAGSAGAGSRPAPEATMRGTPAASLPLAVAVAVGLLLALAVAQHCRRSMPPALGSAATLPGSCASAVSHCWAQLAALGR